MQILTGVGSRMAASRSGASAWVAVEDVRSGFHALDVHGVGDHLQLHLVAVVPVVVVHALADQCHGGLRVTEVSGRHVQVLHEVKYDLFEIICLIETPEYPFLVMLS